MYDRALQASTRCEQSMSSSPVPQPLRWLVTPTGAGGLPSRQSGLRSWLPAEPTYHYRPSWSAGIGDLKAPYLRNSHFGGGTSTATALVTSATALLLDKCGDLAQARVEEVLKSTALDSVAVIEGEMILTRLQARAP